MSNSSSKQTSPILNKGRGRSKTVSSTTEAKFQRDSIVISPTDFDKATNINESTTNLQNSTLLSPSSESTNNKQGEAQLIDDLCNDMTTKIANYLKGELSMTTRDLDLLSDFNYKTIDQYQELSHTAQDILASSSKMQQAYSNLIPYINYVDQVCQQIEYLEVIASELEEYSLNLEEKVKFIKKKKEIKKSGGASNAKFY